MRKPQPEQSLDQRIRVSESVQPTKPGDFGITILDDKVYLNPETVDALKRVGIRTGHVDELLNYLVGMGPVVLSLEWDVAAYERAKSQLRDQLKGYVQETRFFDRDPPPKVRYGARP